MKTDGRLARCALKGTLGEASWSWTKSTDQRLFGPSGAGIGVRATAIRRRDSRRRTASGRLSE